MTINQRQLTYVRHEKPKVIGNSMSLPKRHVMIECQKWSWTQARRLLVFANAMKIFCSGMPFIHFHS